MASRKPAIFDLELRPSRPLKTKQVWLVLAGMAAIFLAVGVRLLFLGAWPILPYMLLDLGLLAWALRESIRSGRQSEHLRLDANGLEFIRIAARGTVLRRHLEAYWVRVELERLGKNENRLWLKSPGDRLVLGSFLSPRERVEIAGVIEDGLRQFRNAAI